MRLSILITGIVLLTLPVAARAEEFTWLQRCAMRTPRPYWPAPHTMERAGYPQEISRCSQPSVACYDRPGYIGGTKLFHNNNLLTRNPTAVTGPIQDGTFATDYAGVRGHLGRVFLAPSNDPSRGFALSRGYCSEGPRVVDIFAIRPLRNAVIEKHEDAKERKHGKECHGEGGH
jgi:hypothetical protein